MSERMIAFYDPEKEYLKAHDVLNRAGVGYSLQLSERIEALAQERDEALKEVRRLKEKINHLEGAQ